MAPAGASPLATRAAQALALGVLGLGGLVLLDRWLYLPAVRALQAAGPGLMKFSAAGCFVGAGLALLLSACRGVVARRLGRVLGAAVAGGGAVALAGCLGQALAGEPALPASVAGPDGRMLPATALGFFLCGLALAAGAARPAGRRGALSLAAAMAAALLALLAVFGYLVDVQALYRLWPYAGMALHTALGLLALCAGWLLLRLGAGWLTRLGLVAATLAVVALLAIGWSAAVRLGVLEPPEGADLRALHTRAGPLTHEPKSGGYRPVKRPGAQC